MSFKETVIGLIPSTWDICDISEVSNVIDSLHQTPTYSDAGIPMVRVTDVKEEGLLLKNCYKVSDEVYELFTKNHIPKLGDIVISRVGTYGVFSNVKTTEKFCLGQNTAIISPTKINSKYLFYNLFNKKTKQQIDNFAVGSTQKTISLKNIKTIKIPVCKKIEQESIAHTLSCLDDKIELNNKMNKTLEEMAQAIFKSWFVDFEPFQDGEFEDSELGRIPKGLKVGTLGDISNITMGQSPKGSSYNENGDGVVFYQGRTDFGSRYPTIRLYTTEPKRTADKGDILLSVRAPVGDINVAIEDCCIGRGLASLKSKDNCTSYLLYQLLNLKASFNIYNGEGTVFGSINKDTLNNMKVLIPLDKHMKEFQFTVGKLDGIIETNSIQIKTLTTIRDSLLPKLMSGEIRVPLNEV